MSPSMSMPMCKLSLMAAVVWLKRPPQTEDTRSGHTPVLSASLRRTRIVAGILEASIGSLLIDIRHCDRETIVL